MTVISALLLRNGKDKEPAGIPLSLANKWKLFMVQCFDCHKCCRRALMDWPTILEMAERAAGSWNQNSLLCEQGPECSHLPFLVSELNKPGQFRWRVLSQDLWQRNPHGSAYWVIFLTLVSPNLWKPFPTRYSSTILVHLGSAGQADGSPPGCGNQCRPGRGFHRTKKPKLSGFVKIRSEYFAFCLFLPVAIRWRSFCL